MHYRLLQATMQGFIKISREAVNELVTSLSLCCHISLCSSLPGSGRELRFIVGGAVKYYDDNAYEPRHDKTNKMSVRPAKT